MDASRRIFGLAPAGVYRAVRVATNAVGSYPTVSPLPPEDGGLFSVALSVTEALAIRAQGLPGSLSTGARTFLEQVSWIPMRDRPTVASPEYSRTDDRRGIPVFGFLTSD